MAGQFDFTSPGAAFSDALTNALVENKAQQRQQLLDSIGVRAAQRADSEADQMKTYQQYEMDMGRERNERERLEELTKNLPIDANPEALGWSPDDIALGSKYGRWKQQQVMTAPPTMGQDSATGSTPGTPAEYKTQYSNIGTQQQQLLKQSQDAWAKTRLGVADPGALRYLDEDAALHNGVPSDQALQHTIPHRLGILDARGPRPTLIGPNGAALPFGPNGEMPFGTDTIEKPLRQPVAPRERYNYQKDDNGQIWRIDTDAKHPTAELVTTPGGQPLTSGNKGNVHFNEGGQNEYNRFKVEFGRNPNALNGALLRGATTGMITTSSAPMKVQALAFKVVMGDASAAAELQNVSNLQNGWTAPEKAQLDYILSTIWPQDLAQSFYAAAQPKSSGAMGWIKNFAGYPATSDK